MGKKVLTSIYFLYILSSVNKKNVTIKLHPEMISAIEGASEVSGLKKNTIIERGIDCILEKLRVLHGMGVDGASDIDSVKGGD